jgi:hypothetical protein
MRLIGLAVILSLTLAPLATGAQEAGKVARVGCDGRDYPPPGDFGQREAFEGGLRDLGWTPGTNILIDTGTPRASPSACRSWRPVPPLRREVRSG